MSQFSIQFDSNLREALPVSVDTGRDGAMLRRPSEACRP